MADAAPHPGGDWDRWALVREAVLAGTEIPEHPGHDLAVAPGSRLAAALGTESHWVNSWHHQAIDALGDGVVATARAPDGVIEAVEVEGDAWVLGVQWELQESWKDDPRCFARVRGVRQRDSASSSPPSSRVKRAAEGMFSRSPGACGPSICGPNEIASIPGRLAVISDASSPPWVTVTCGRAPNSSACTALAVASSAESGSGRQPG